MNKMNRMNHIIPIGIFVFLVSCRTTAKHDFDVNEHELQAYITRIKHNKSAVGIVYGGREPVLKKGKTLSPASMSKLAPYEKSSDANRLVYEIASVGYGLEGINWHNWGVTLEIDPETRVILSVKEWIRHTEIIGCP